MFMQREKGRIRVADVEEDVDVDWDGDRYALASTVEEVVVVEVEGKS